MYHAHKCLSFGSPYPLIQVNAALLKNAPFSQAWESVDTLSLSFTCWLSAAFSLRRSLAVCGLDVEPAQAPIPEEYEPSGMVRKF